MITLVIFATAAILTFLVGLVIESTRMISPHQLARMVETSIHFPVFALEEKLYFHNPSGKVLVEVVGYTISIDQQGAEVQYIVEPLESLRTIYPSTGQESEFDLMTVTSQELCPRLNFSKLLYFIHTLR